MDLKSKTIAIASGKGGVGKTTTAINLALYAAKKGLRTALVDVDPFSNSAYTLDVDERRLAPFSDVFSDENSSLEENRLRVFPKMDLLFPAAKLKSVSEGDSVYTQFIRLKDRIEAEYDFVILDLPAGNTVAQENKIISLPSRFIIVTNTEPTSHVAAGALVKSLSEMDVDISFWHNKYQASFTQTFDPKNVIYNYNKNSMEEDRIPADIAKKFDDIAFIPQDPAMDLLQTSPSIQANIRRSLLDIVEVLQREYRSLVLKHSSLKPGLEILLLDFFALTPSLKKPDEALSAFERHLNFHLQQGLLQEAAAKLQGSNLLNTDERQGLHDLFVKLLDHKYSRSLKKAGIILTRSLEDLETGLFSSAQTKKVSNHELDAVMSELLEYSSTIAKRPDFIRFARLLMFYFSLLKLFQSESMNKLLLAFIPKRKKSGEKIVRDKHRQIQRLILKDSSYQKSYFQLVKQLFPVFLSHLKSVNEALGLDNLLFLDSTERLNQKVYLQLLTNFLHDTINSGLGVIIGFRYRPASRAFENASEQVLRRVFKKPQVSTGKKV
jgi:cellulose biosynthesis protein BcsQ